MTLRLERDGAVARLLIDRPERRDAVTLAMFRDAFASPDFTEGMAAFREKRRPVF